MTKAEKTARLKEAGLDDATIEALLGGDSNESEIAALKAKLAEAEGKANGILGDKKKQQQKVEELQAKLDELEGKDLGEAGKLKLEMERMKARLDKAEKDKTDLEATYTTEKRNSELSKIAQRLKFLDTVPEDTRSLIISNELKDLQDLGNTVLVDERLKSVSTKYAGLLAANVTSGAGTKAGQQTNQTGNRPTLDALKTKSLSEIAKDPKAYVKEFMAAAEAEK
jgi:hypothetical protein